MHLMLMYIQRHCTMYMSYLKATVQLTISEIYMTRGTVSQEVEEKEEEIGEEGEEEGEEREEEFLSHNMPKNPIKLSLEEM